MIKKFTAVALAVTILASMSITAFAHCGNGRGHHGGGRNRQAHYAFCTVDDCGLAYNHTHGEGNYYAHYDGDGHTHNNEHCPLVTQ